MSQESAAESEDRIDVSRFFADNDSAAEWANGYGAIQHSDETRGRVVSMAQAMAKDGVRGDCVDVFELLRAADRIASAAMWLVVHQTYAQNVYLDGRPLAAGDFKPKPEGHTGGSLNMVPAYAGYLAANALSGTTRSWIMGQGHCVSAIDSLNLLVNNMTEAHAQRYATTDEGLTRYVRDFYSYQIGDDGRQDSPLGSHVNAHTAGGLAEGGYLGFVELQYVHMPLPGERLVAFLSDGAFEEQRGSDWIPRWWRAEDCGFVTPIMIKNGRRIDQRTTLSQSGGTDWFVEHLKLNGFDPIVFDGRDPAAFAWAIWEMERRLTAAAAAVRSGEQRYPVSLPYGIAVAPKGAGFYGEGTNLAHNLPLMSNPSADPAAARNFNESARRLWVPLDELRLATSRLQCHADSGRVRERDHSLVNRQAKVSAVPPLSAQPVPQNCRDRSQWTRSSPMDAVDVAFLAHVQANPHLRPRVGNPDEMKSNRLIRTLEALKFRVTDPEPGIPEDLHGAVITALNEEAVACAALANKAGINLIHTYEAFGTKMQGVLRQEIIFTQHCKELGRPQNWLSVPLILTSHTWENSKNELSHQDPALAEAMLGETSDVSRVIFVPDFNTASAVMSEVYRTNGQIWSIVVPKADTVGNLFTPEDAQLMVRQGALKLDWAGHESSQAPLVMTAIGAYQLEETLKASERLSDRGLAHSVVCMLEPGRFRSPRNRGEYGHVAPRDLVEQLYPDTAPQRLFVTHTRPEPLLGVLQPLHTGSRATTALGFLGQGGTLTVSGMLYVNRSTWAHIVLTAARLLDVPRDSLLTADELAALDGVARPEKALW